MLDLDAATIGEDSFPHYAAAEKRNIGFEFEIMTPIKGGYVRFSIPSSGGWAQPRHTDVAGTARVKLHSRGDDANTLGDGARTLVDKYGADDNITISASGNQITVNIKELDATVLSPRFVTVQYGVGTGDHQGQVQYTAAADVPIIGRFKSGARSGDYPAAPPISIRIGNVEDGSGTAQITSPSDHTVNAGSKDNTIRDCLHGRRIDDRR